MKGDVVAVTTSVGGLTQTIRIEATKAGRNVQTRYAGKWLYVTEVSRSTEANPKGRAGNSLRVRIEAIVSVEERHQDLPEAVLVREAATSLGLDD